MSTIVEAAPEAGASKKFDVTVEYNGMSKTIEVQPNQAISAVLQHAINAFGPLPGQHTLALYNEAGDELPDTAHVKDVGINPGDRLLLRPSKVKGG
ncbi:MAG: hypothetical protein GC190_04555 [Alphaproteobacteria bacterium]|nr:hypothetical protein [Alphaproteobacteria bacterium]